MDKAQHELLKSYYRVRNIQVESEEGSYRRYELNSYALKEGMLNVRKLDGVDMAEMIGNDPDSLEFLENKKHNLYYSFTSMDITEILRHQPQLYSKIAQNINLNKLTQTSIARILGDQPQLHTKFDLTNIDSNYSVTELLMKQPQFMFAVNLENMNGHNIGDLLREYSNNGDKESYDKLMDAVNFTGMSNENIFRAFFKIPETIDLFSDAKITEIFAGDPTFAGEFIKKNPELFDKLRSQAMRLPKEEMIQLLKYNHKIFFVKFRTRFNELDDSDIEYIVKGQLPKGKNELRGYINTYKT